MIAKIEKSVLHGEVTAPPSKSMAHRLLLLAALSGGRCKVDNLAMSQDVLAMIDCLRALGAAIEISENSAAVDGSNLLKSVSDRLDCRESGNTLRFLIPLCLTACKDISLYGSGRLMDRPQEIYEQLCREHGFLYKKGDGFITVRGDLKPGVYELSGSVSSQFISGLIFGLLSLSGDSEIRIIPPFESRSYVDLTLSAIKKFGGSVHFKDEYTVLISGKSLKPADVVCEGDFSNAAFLDAFNVIGGSVKVNGLSDNSVQGDRIYREYFPKFIDSAPEIDITDCPDLGPICMALGALNHGCKLVGTRRLAMKESDRGRVMHDELLKFGCEIDVKENSITVPKSNLHSPVAPLNGHNDHRIVMSLAVICTVTGGEIEGCEAVSKTFPDFFDAIKSLGCDVKIRND